MNKYREELPDNDVDYPRFMDSSDMYFQERSRLKSMRELKARLIIQVQTNGITNCGLTSIEQINRIFPS